MSPRSEPPAGEAALVSELARRLRDRVVGQLGGLAARAAAGAGAGGDVTFAIDELAERELEEFIARRAPRLAFYSEDRGLVEPEGEARGVLVVDPVDGTRPAMAGLESACVSVALAPLDGGEPTMGDVRAGCIVEIKSGHAFLATRGGGVRSDVPLRRSANERLDRLFLAYGLRGRPVRSTAEVLAELIDGCLAGGAFELGAATYDMTRLLTGQLDAYVEPGARLVAEVPMMRAAFERVGGGHVLNNSPYDLAAAVLICQEGGAVVTDAAGGRLDDRPLLGSGAEFQMSCVAAANPGLHAKLLAAVERGMARLRAAAAT